MKEIIGDFSIIFILLIPVIIIWLVIFILVKFGCKLPKCPYCGSYEIFTYQDVGTICHNCNSIIKNI